MPTLTEYKDYVEKSFAKKNKDTHKKILAVIKQEPQTKELFKSRKNKPLVDFYAEILLKHGFPLE